MKTVFMETAEEKLGLKKKDEYHQLKREIKSKIRRDKNAWLVRTNKTEDLENYFSK